MHDLHLLQPLEPPFEPGRHDRDQRPVGVSLRGVLFGALALLASGGIGTWLVWYGVHLDHRLTLEEIREACARAMPEATDRCVDTVVIQRGGVRR